MAASCLDFSRSFNLQSTLFSYVNINFKWKEIQQWDGKMSQGASDHEGNTENWKRNNVGHLNVSLKYQKIPEMFWKRRSFRNVSISVF